MTRSKTKFITKISPITLFWISFGMLFLSISFLGLSLWIQRGGFDAQPVSGYPLNTTVRFNQSLISVSKVYTTKGTGVFSAPTGKTYLVLTLSVTNITNKSIMIVPSVDTYLKDQQGNMTYLTPSVLVNPLRSGPLLKGDSIQGQLSYLIPKNIKQSLYIDATWTGGVVKFALQ